VDDLLNKDKTIQIIWTSIVKAFGNNFFSKVDFWDADNYAFGIRKKEKLIYISTWDFKESTENDVRCFAEFDLLNQATLETVERVKEIKDVGIDELIFEIKNFIS
jgi:hypothetical protein